MEVLRNFYDWEVYDYQSFLGSFSSIALVESDDQPIWTLNPNGSFYVGSFYKYLIEDDDVEDKFMTLPRIAFLVWEVGSGHILTMDMLIRRGKIMVNSCYLCKMTEETRDHILH